MMKIDKKAIIVFVLSLFILVTSIIFYLFLNTKDILLVPNLTCNFRDEVYLKNFIYKLDGTLKNNYKIDTRKVGKQEVKAVYQDKYGFYKAKRFNITVKDKVAPTILVTSDYTVVKGYDKRLEDEILCADDYDNKINCSIEGSYNFDEVGVYPLTIKAVDKSGNKNRKNFNLKVIEDTSQEEKIVEDSEKDKIEEFVSYSDIYKKYKGINTSVGLDLSKYQKKVDFKALKDNNVEFVFIKVGGQKNKDGKIIMDPFFENNVEGALKNGIKVGLYFYSYAKNPLEARKQAMYIIKKIKGYNISLPIAFDWENWQEYNQFNISFNTLNNMASTFIDEIERNGYEGMLYSSKYYFDNVWFKEDFRNVWIANYGILSDSSNYYAWQLCDNGKIEGIDGFVDIDIIYN